MSEDVPPTLLALDSLRLTREGNTLWVEGAAEPLTADNARMRFCTIGGHGPGFVFATGTREHLKTVDAFIKVVTVGRGGDK